MSRILVTESGLEKLRAELSRLKTEERPAIIRAIAEAAQHGDLSENAEYHAAREKQSFTEGRIAQLEGALQNIEVFDIKSCQGKQEVFFGAQVTLVDEETERTMQYTIVSQMEASPESRLISNGSPLAKALLGRKKGESVEVVLPNAGVRYYFIEDVNYASF